MSQPELFQVKWFNKRKGYGFALSSTGEELFCHHSDIRVDGYKYLKRGEYVNGVRVKMEGDKSKVGQISAPLLNGKLMCEVERHEVRDKTDAKEE
jgi:CspA family cold shock protein